jgi:hypothetical protein
MVVKATISKEMKEGLEGPNTFMTSTGNTTGLLMSS